MVNTERPSILVIRADADSVIGTGHVMRCLALAQEILARGGTASFAACTMSLPLEKRLAAEGIGTTRLISAPGSVEDAAETVELARRGGADLVVLDGYHFARRYQEILFEAGVRTLLIDDHGGASYYASEFVLNQNFKAQESLYKPRGEHTRLLLGADYALIRREFWPWRHWQREIRPVGRRVLVTLGGSDPENVTQRVIAAIDAVPARDLETLVIVGFANPRFEELCKAGASHARSTTIVQNVVDMPARMAWADVAISAGGNTSWELAFMGLPSLLIPVADNQDQNVEALHQAGVAFSHSGKDARAGTELGDVLLGLLSTPKQRSSMSAKGQMLVDGFGPERVLEAILEPVRVRRVVESDCEQIWHWANDPAARNVSFSRRFISWEEHHSWFTRKVADPDCFQYVGLDDRDRLIGQVRFDVENGRAAVSVSLDERYRGQGNGVLLIRAGVRAFKRLNPAMEIDAFVMTDNLRSLSAFGKAGFAMVDYETRQGFDAIRLACRGADVTRGASLSVGG